MGRLEADDLKHRGDLAYKASCFTRAIRHYTAAISLDTSSQSVYANRSASKFESGDYEGSLDDAATAFKLDTTSSLAQKLALRAYKACYWSCDLLQARAWLEESRLRSSCDSIRVLQSHLDSVDKRCNGAASNTLPQLLLYRTSSRSGCHWRVSRGGSVPRSLLSGMYSFCTCRSLQTLSLQWFSDSSKSFQNQTILLMIQ